MLTMSYWFLQMSNDTDEAILEKLSEQKVPETREEKKDLELEEKVV